MSTPRPKMRFLHPSQRHTRPSVSPNTALPPRGLFTGHSSLLATYDAWTRVEGARKQHEADAYRLDQEATTAAREYSEAIKTALRAGTSASEVRSTEPELRAQAAAHRELALEAKRESIAFGTTLADALTAAAPDVYPNIEAEMETHAASIRAALDSLSGAYSKWAALWHLRRILGSIVANGGPLGSYRPNPPLPANVASALQELVNELDTLPQLRIEEAYLAEWRRTQTDIDEANRLRAEASVASVIALRARLAAQGSLNY
ncbi:hypothetical protein [Tessaracoccus sp. Z1128]